MAACTGRFLRVYSRNNRKTMLSCSLSGNFKRETTVGSVFVILHKPRVELQ